MNRIAIFLSLTILIVSACNKSFKNIDTMPTEKEPEICSDNCKAKTRTTELRCKLPTPELQKRKETVIASLKKRILDKKELQNGFAFKFGGTDEILDELMDFIKTERACCAFFTFGLSISGDKSEAWLELTGENGAKDFVTSELRL